MFCIISGNNIFFSKDINNILNICMEYYINISNYNKNITPYTFIKDYIILEYNNNIIIHKYDYTFILEKFINKLKEINIYNILNNDPILSLNNKNNNLLVTSNNKKINQNDIIINQKLEENNNIKKEEFNRQSEYEHIFSDITPKSYFINQTSTNNINKLEGLLKIKRENYELSNFKDLINVIKIIIAFEPINNTNIELINKTINLLCDLYTNKFKNLIDKKEIPNIIILFDEKLKQYNKQIDNYKKHQEYKQKEKIENIKNIYETNKKTYEQIKNNFEKNNINNIDEILCDINTTNTLIPDNFKIMYYSYKNSNNLDDFIKCFNEYYNKYNPDLILFKEFLN